MSPYPIDLDLEACEALLRAGSTGRVAVSTPDGPHIVPVNYLVVGRSLIFRTTAYSLLGTYARNSLLAMEIDHAEDEDRSWSVLVRGRCQFVDDPREIEQMQAARELRAWAAGSRNLFLRLPWTELSGRQLGPGWTPVDLPVTPLPH